MGEFVAAGLLSHVPTIMLPEATRLELNEGKEISLVTSLNKLRKDVFETMDYDTVLVLDSHWFTTVEFVVTAHQHRKGFFTAEELPRGMCHIPYEWDGDPEFARAIASHADEVGDTYAGLTGPIVVTKRGMARADGSPKDVDHEAFFLFSVMNEGLSPYLADNVRRFAENEPLLGVMDRQAGY